MKWQIPGINLKLQHEPIQEEINEAIRQVLQHQAFILGPEVGQLEEAVARIAGCSHAVGCASGSDALLLALMALSIGPGDRVLVPTLTFFATAGSVARSGAVPVFVDIDPRTFNLDPKATERILRLQAKSDRCKAMIPVHLYGQCADMDPLSELASEYNLALIEDAAQAILAQYRQRPAGSMGICGCFSFFPTKNLGAFGDAGLITTRDFGLAERLRMLRNHGAVQKYVHASVGINSRLDTLQAAVLLVKLRYLEKWTLLKQSKAEFYRTAFQEAGLSHAEQTYPGQKWPVVLPYPAHEGCHVYHQFTIRVHRRDELRSYLASKGIEAVVHYPVPLHLQPAFSFLGGKVGECPEAERAVQEVLSLPIYPEITEDQQNKVVEEIKNFYTRLA
ncbi:MAG: DegT/DnrJ/EryC1/StrS family aminotransferase [Acidobacteria bacterium]|nr:DegT/DnrJ/EryC1/StrS family aminotransferase [Acidobacteriota bacterium]